MSNIESMDNTQSGILITTYQSPVFIEDLVAHKNQHGLCVKDSSSSFVLNSSSLSSNRNSGFITLNSNGLYQISDSEMANNEHGINVEYTNVCHYSSVTTRIIHSLVVLKSTFVGNHITGLSHESNCRWNVSLLQNFFQANAKALDFIHSGNNAINNTITMDENIISNNTYGCRMELQCTLNVVFTFNNVSENNGPALHLTQKSTNARTSVDISHNIFDKNIVSNGDLVTIVLAKYNTHETDMLPLRLIWNTFQNNKVEPALLYYVYTNQAFGAILHVNTEDNVDMMYNIFDDNDAAFQLAIPHTNTFGRIDARYCFWGTSSEDIIVEHIFVYQQINSDYLDMILYHPYLSSKNYSDFDTLKPRYQSFLRGHKVGGVVIGSETLPKANFAYEVVRDVIIPTGSVLTIEPGVEIHFRLGTLVQVYGSLEMQGEPESKIVLTSFQMPTNVHVRLTFGLHAWEGFVEYNIKEKWLPLCQGSYSSQTLNFLCHAAGYQTKVSHSWLENEVFMNSTVKSLTCPGRYVSECIVEYNKFCSTGKYLYMECRKNYWSGIQFSVHAKPSLVSHTIISETGSSMKNYLSAIQIDLNRHQFSDIVLNEMFPSNSVRGIFLQISGVYYQVLDDINITMIGGSGIHSYDSGFVVQNTIIHGASTGMYMSSADVNVLLNSSVVVDLCDANISYNLLDDDDLFLQITDRVSRNYGKSCETYIQSAYGKPIVLQILKISYYSQCYKENLKLFHGHMNASKPYNFTLDKKWKDRMISEDEGKGIHVVFNSQHSYYYYGCVDIVVMITVRDKIEGLYVFLYLYSSI